jgi:hypothetical protein
MTDAAMQERPFWQVRVLSVRQPWAWLLIHGGKDIENRSWGTDYRGPLAIHACGQYASREHPVWRRQIEESHGVLLPEFFGELRTGGLVGLMQLVGCSRKSDSRWFTGEGWAWHMIRPTALEFLPVAGRLGLWHLPLQALGPAGVAAWNDLRVIPGREREVVA